jgi:hypothetical protein
VVYGSLRERGCGLWGVAAGLPNCAMVLKARVEGLRDLGMCANPFGSFMLLQGVETLALRMERHCSNTNELARWLQYHEGVSVPPPQPPHCSSLATDLVIACHADETETTTRPETCTRIMSAASDDGAHDVSWAAVLHSIRCNAPARLDMVALTYWETCASLR